MKTLDAKEAKENLSFFTKRSEKFALMKLSGEFYSKEYAQTIASDMKYLIDLNLYPVLCIGAGIILDDMTKSDNREIKKKNGIRISDERDIHNLNKAMNLYVDLLNEYFDKYNVPSKYLPSCINAQVQPEYGLVGKVTQIDMPQITDAVKSSKIPIIRCLSKNGLNINADHVLSYLVKELKPQKLIIFTKTGGIHDKHGNLVRKATLEELETMVAEGIINNGMALKVSAMKDVVQYVKAVQLTSPENILEELFTHFGNG